MPWHFLASATLLGAAIAGVLLALRRTDHAPFAGLVALLISEDILRRWLAAHYGLVGRPLDAPPFVGAARAAFHVDQGITLASMAAMVAATIVLFGHRRTLALLPGAAWAAVLAYLATHYPAIRGESLRQVYLVCELGALFAVVLSIAYWIPRHERVTSGRLCLGLFASADLAMLIAGAWRWGYFDRYEVTQAGLVVLYLVLTLYQGVTWLSLSRSAH